MILLVGAFIFMRLLPITRIAFVTADFISGLAVNRYIILVIILVVHLILGMLFDIMAIIVLTVPIIFPTILTLDFDPL